MIKVAIAGDCLPKSRVSALAEEGKYSDVFSEVRKLNENFDYCIVNLECPILKKESQPIDKIGFKYYCSESGISLLDYGLFDCVTLANNHFNDYGEAGIEQTLYTLNKHSIAYVGGGKNIEEASQTFYKDINGERLAIINCCEHEFSIATNDHGGCNPLDPISQYYAIKHARKQADYVIVIVHGGVEKYSFPTPRMQQTYRFFIDSGADAVINHHQHCYCGTEKYKAKPIIYGLGNFCFDVPEKIDSSWNRGYMVCLNLNCNEIDFQLFPYTQCSGTPDVRFLSEDKKELFFKNIEKLNAIIADSKALQSYFEKCVADTSGYFSSILTPYTSKLTKHLYNKRLLPSFFPKKKWLNLLNMIRCESHRERFIHYIQKKTIEE